MNLVQKKEELRNLINGQKHVAVGFSGGLDSAALLAFIKKECNSDVTAFMIQLDMLPQSEMDQAIAFCEKWDIPYYIDILHELQLDGFVNNPPDRCYRCKRALFGLVQKNAQSIGISYIADGSLLDDLDDYRPGMKALQELGIASPFIECGLTKADIIAIADDYEIDFAHRPKFSCLYTRFKTGSEIDNALFKVIGEAEGYLAEQGCKNVRVRIQEDTARIEVHSEDIAKVAQPTIRKNILKILKAGGLNHVVLDLAGYQQGSMN